jgi:PAS domain S-box-containing protein
MTFTRMKTLGLLSLVLILALICSGALVQTRRVTGILADVGERLIPALGVIYPIQRLLAEANDLFHEYHERGRVTESEVRTPLIALGDTVSGLAPLLAPSPEDLRTYQRLVRTTVGELAALGTLEEAGGSRRMRDSPQATAAEASIAELRRRLRALAMAVAPAHRATARAPLARASSQLRSVQQKLAAYVRQEASPIPSVQNLLATADSRLEDLLGLDLPPRFQEEIQRLRGNLTEIQASVRGYLDDQQDTRSDASADTLDHAHEQIHDLWQQARISGTWITRNIHREVWLSTQAAAATARQGQVALVILGLTGIAVAAGTAVVLGRSLGRHVVQMSTATRRFAAGDYADRLPARGGDEMARLAGSLNRMADKLQAREQDLARLAAAVQHTADGVLIAAPDGTVEYVNPSFEQITGRAAEELVGRPLEAPGEDASARGPGQRLQQVLATGRPWSGRRSARRSDGSTYQELCSISPVLGPGGEVERLAVVVRDITRDVQIEERVKESQKLQALGTLAGGIAHDFNNLLVPILGYAEMLLARTPEQDPAHRKLQRMASAAERARELVEQVLTFSRAGEKEKAPLHLAPLVKEVVKLVGVQLPDNVAVHHRVAPDLPPVLGDPVQLHQALMNLLTNAAHAMEPDGGELEICLEPGAGEAAGQVCLTVRDTGCGMSPEVQSRIFEPFFTTKGVGKGTGLGLSVVHGIVEDHGGTIDVESRPGIGTRFRLHLPGTAAGPPPVRENPGPPRRGTERILLVEDEAAVAEVLQEALEECGYRVTATDRATKALHLLAAPAAPFDLVLTDQRMPGMSGTQLIEAMRQHCPHLPVVLCTGHYGESGDLTPQTSGAKAVLYKPVHPGALGRVVRSVLDRDTDIGRRPQRGVS